MSASVVTIDSAGPPTFAFTGTAPVVVDSNGVTWYYNDANAWTSGRTSTAAAASGGWQTAPSIPATTVNYTNILGTRCFVYITSAGGAVTAITIDGTATGLTLGTATTSTATVVVPNGSTINMTYASTAPTWKWYAA